MSTNVTKMSAKARDAVSAAVLALEPEADGLEKAKRPTRRRRQELVTAAEPVMRPNGEEYLPRPVGDLTDVETLRKAREAGMNSLLSGYPGTGKTAMVEAAFGNEVVIVEGHGDMEVSDMIGSYVAMPDGNFVWVDGPVIVAMRNGYTLFIDDFTLIPPQVLTRIYPLMDGRGVLHIREHEGEMVEAKPGCVVVGAHNPDAPGAILSAPMRSRFHVQMEVKTDLTMAARLGVPQKAILCAAALRRARDAGESGWAPETRDLKAFRDVSAVFGESFAAANMLASAPEEEREQIQEKMRSYFSGVQPLEIAEAPVGREPKKTIGEELNDAADAGITP